MAGFAQTVSRRDSSADALHTAQRHAASDAAGVARGRNLELPRAIDLVFHQRPWQQDLDEGESAKRRKDKGKTQRLATKRRLSIFGLLFPCSTLDRFLSQGQGKKTPTTLLHQLVV